jgi:methylenetetrahydrofolate reductase (NADPH)
MIFFTKLKDNTSFPVCYNLLPHFTAIGLERSMLMDSVKEALADGRINTFFLADQPVHPQRASSLDLAKDILDAGGEPLVSLALTLYDRNTATDRLQEYYRTGVRQFLFVTGDFPAVDENRAVQPVFDLDSVQLLMKLDGIHETENISKGCAISPFKSIESEQVWQYEKLKRKIEVGADFVISQLGYDIRKSDELLKYCALQKITTPVVGNIFITDLQNARQIMGKTIPGVKIPHQLLRTLEEEECTPLGARDKRIVRAAKTLSVLQGLGYHGTLISSSSSGFSEVKHVLDEAEGLLPEWQDFLGELDYSDSSFYYFQKNSHTGLNSSQPSLVAPKHFPHPLYSFSYFVDWLAYEPRGPLFKVTGWFCRFCNGRKFWNAFIWLQEYLPKRILYGCRMCGDCLLYACGFLCYQSGCPKKIANGPCGGSMDGYCEVFPDKKLCFWVKVYNNMKGVRHNITFVTPPIPTRDMKLDRTCSWINFFLGKDHRKMKLFDD